jgi:hypothetical protein
MSSKQGPRCAGMRPSAIADDRRHNKFAKAFLTVKEAGA